jgi:hypothetical protein
MNYLIRVPGVNNGSLCFVLAKSEPSTGSQSKWSGLVKILKFLGSAFSEIFIAICVPREVAFDPMLVSSLGIDPRLQSRPLVPFSEHPIFSKLQASIQG